MDEEYEETEKRAKKLHKKKKKKESSSSESSSSESESEESESESPSESSSSSEEEKSRKRKRHERERKKGRAKKGKDKKDKKDKKKKDGASEKKKGKTEPPAAAAPAATDVAHQETVSTAPAVSAPAAQASTSAADPQQSVAGQPGQQSVSSIPSAQGARDEASVANIPVRAADSLSTQSRAVTSSHVSTPIPNRPPTVTTPSAGATPSLVDSELATPLSGMTTDSMNSSASRRRLEESYDDNTMVVNLNNLTAQELDILGTCNTALTDAEILAADLCDLTMPERQRRKVLKHRQSQKAYTNKMLEQKGKQ